jgi:hypothetical protein
MPVPFGFGVGDILEVIRIAWNCYIDCREAGGAFREISHQAWSLHSALTTIHDEVDSQNSILAQQHGARKRALVDTINDCEEIIYEVATLVDSYGSLNPARESSLARRAWDHARYSATQVSQRLHVIRTRLTGHVATIMLQLELMGVVATGQIRNTLDAIRREMREGLAGNETAIFAVARRVRRAQAESVSSSGRGGIDDDGWREIKEELKRQGFGKREIKRSKRVLLAYIRERPVPDVAAHVPRDDERRARSLSSSGTSSGSSRRGRRRVRGRRKTRKSRYPVRLSPLPETNGSFPRTRERSQWSSIPRSPPPPYRSRSRLHSRGPYTQYAPRRSPNRRRHMTNTEMVLLGVAVASVSYIALDIYEKKKKKKERGT